MSSKCKNWSPKHSSQVTETRFPFLLDLKQGRKIELKLPINILSNQQLTQRTLLGISKCWIRAGQFQPHTNSPQLVLQVLEEDRNQLNSPPPDSNSEYLNSIDQGYVFLAFISTAMSQFRLSPSPRALAALPRGFLWSQGGQCMVKGLNPKPHTCSYKLLTGTKSLCASAIQLPLKPTSLTKEIKATTCLDMVCFPPLQAYPNPKSQDSLGKVQRPLI